jgi:hypothetical protein
VAMSCKACACSCPGRMGTHIHPCPMAC